MLRATRLLRLKSAGSAVKICLVPQQQVRFSPYNTGSVDNSDSVQPTDTTKATETTEDKQEKKKPRIQYMAVREPSEALRRMAQMISNNQQPQDAGGEIESFRFTTDDLIRELPAFRAKSLGSKAAAEASLVIATMEERIRLMDECRRSRINDIKTAFNAKQLQEYLRHHGQKTSGSKDLLIVRIVDKVWGISGRDFEARLAKSTERTTDDGIVLPLGDEAWSQLQEIEDDFIKQIEYDFSVKISFDEAKRSVKANGSMHNVRAALSSLREGLTARTTVEVVLDQYGTPRRLSAKHASRISSRLNHAVPAATVSNYEGQVFVGGERLAALDAQQALVDAMVEDPSSQFVAVVPESLTQALVSTLVPAAAVFSRSRSFLPDNAIHISGVSDFAMPQPALANHSLMRYSPSTASMFPEDKPVIPFIQDWLSNQKLGDGFSLSARLGRVLLDVDSEQKPLGTSFYKPIELLEAIGQRSPMFSFASDVSPLRWLHGNSEPVRSHIKLTFWRTSAEPENGKSAYRLPVYSTETLEVRIPTHGRDILFDGLQARLVNDASTINIAILSASHDLQLQGVSSEALDPSTALMQDLRNVVRHLGMSSNLGVSSMRRHETFELAQLSGRFALQSAVFDRVITRKLVDGTEANMHQTLDLIDDLKFSQIALHPELGSADEDRLGRFFSVLFQAVFEHPSAPSTSVAFR
ncbi:hypothetical protein GGI15_004082 [Coemansia interrupta]|uniref:SAP domain-containing protein n=1 Tax=Coemansia interrupta TaxID=1126814 RepID=A0A9W8H934_9FUNG|nr:hypothetical protein GGI15_004082 [Coemansia interrupta]